MKDSIGRDLKIGDIVSYWSFGWKRVLIGEVSSFTPQNVKIARIRVDINSDGVKTLIRTPFPNRIRVSPKKMTIINELVRDCSVVPHPKSLY